jgi:broad specificity phosphatase PhoE
MSDALPRVWLVRHGETEWSVSRQHTGRTDIPLTERGEHDARELQTRLQGQQFARVLTSPLIRARHTAELAGFADRLELDPDLMEWDYGICEGRRTSEIRAEQPGWRLFEEGCPGGETLDDVSSRADRVIARARLVKGDTLVFSHRDLLRVLAVRWIALPPIEGRRLYLETSSISILGYHHDLTEPVILSLNTSEYRSS